MDKKREAQALIYEGRAYFYESLSASFRARAARERGQDSATHEAHMESCIASSSRKHQDADTLTAGGEL